MGVGLYEMGSKPRCGRGWTGGVLGGGMSGGGISGGKTFKIKDRPSRHEIVSSKVLANRILRDCKGSRLSEVNDLRGLPVIPF